MISRSLHDILKVLTETKEYMTKFFHQGVLSFNLAGEIDAVPVSIELKGTIENGIL